MIQSSTDLTVLVSTFQRPKHLLRCLTSLTKQTIGVDRFEVVIADDGSCDETSQVVDSFRRRHNLRITFCTHEHRGFRKCEAVNKALHHVRSPYVVLTDGDCIFAPDHLDTHLRVKRPKTVWAGNSIFLDQSISEQIDLDSIASKRWLDWVPHRLPLASRIAHHRARFYSLMSHSSKPKVVGNNIGLWSDQLLSINGFDQSFQGWGCEDDDLGLRLRLDGNRVRSLLGHTHAFHLWHPPHETKPSKWSQGANVARLNRPLILSHCLNGMTEKPFEQISVHVESGEGYDTEAELLKKQFTSDSNGKAEVEILFWPGNTSFSNRSECNVVVGRALKSLSGRLRRQTDFAIQLPSETASSQDVVNCVISELRQALGANAKQELRQTPPVEISLHRVRISTPSHTEDKESVTQTQRASA